MAPGYRFVKRRGMKELREGRIFVISPFSFGTISTKCMRKTEVCIKQQLVIIPANEAIPVAI